MKRQIQINDMIVTKFYLTVILRKYIFFILKLSRIFGHITGL